MQYFCLPFLQSSLNFGVDFCFSSNFYLLICLFDCFSFEGSQCHDLGGNWLTTVCLYCNCNFSYRKLHPPSSVIVHHPIQTKIKMHKNENKKWLTHPNSTHRPIKTQIKIHKNKDKKWLTNLNSKKVKHLSTSGNSRNYVIHQYLLVLQTSTSGFGPRKRQNHDHAQGGCSRV